MTNYVNEEDEDNKYSSEEKISDETPQVEVDSTEDSDWGTDEEDDKWGEEEVEVEGDEIPDTVEEPTEDTEEIPDSIEEPSTEEINSEPESEEPKGFRVLSFEDFISNK